jgi:hypothetical protein
LGQLVSIVYFYARVFFKDVIDVVGDEHCELRVIFGLLGNFVDRYHIICFKLTIELNKHKERPFSHCLLVKEDSIRSKTLWLMQGSTQQLRTNRWLCPLWDFFWHKFTNMDWSYLLILGTLKLAFVIISIAKMLLWQN